LEHLCFLLQFVEAYLSGFEFWCTDLADRDAKMVYLSGIERGLYFMGVGIFLPLVSACPLLVVIQASACQTLSVHRLPGQPMGCKLRFNRCEVGTVSAFLTSPQERSGLLIRGLPLTASVGDTGFSHTCLKKLVCFIVCTVRKFFPHLHCRT
jgi:hypothetical protein